MSYKKLQVTSVEFDQDGYPILKGVMRSRSFFLISENKDTVNPSLTPDKRCMRCGMSSSALLCIECDCKAFNKIRERIDRW